MRACLSASMHADISLMFQKDTKYIRMNAIKWPASLGLMYASVQLCRYAQPQLDGPVGSDCMVLSWAADILMSWGEGLSDTSRQAMLVASTGYSCSTLQLSQNPFFRGHRPEGPACAKLLSDRCQGVRRMYVRTSKVAVLLPANTLDRPTSVIFAVTPSWSIITLPALMSKMMTCTRHNTLMSSDNTASLQVAPTVLLGSQLYVHFSCLV